MAALVSVPLLTLVTTAPAEAFVAPEDVLARADAQGPEGPRAQRIHLPGGAAETVQRYGMDVSSAAEAAALARMRTADTFVNDASWAVQWPFRVGVPISDGFGARVAPTAGASSFHRGVDFTPGEGVPVQVIADGVVRTVTGDDDNSCGVHVIVDHVIHGQAVSSVYCHMQRGSTRVSVGQRVRVGDIVGLVGSTGVSTGAHLHFEIRLGGTEAVDPLAWLKANAG